ncbi:hypothetical protein D9613_008396 [Agrocybe pediades]|uniref:GS catalytic domain-containing protein n=1 Tax=Agrocybe pediades TaxID=84607 RepID=A0A8H4QU05_9AGAR|nr:hypothetical protein D9613_008396 [Agrocybe pediades]
MSSNVVSVDSLRSRSIKYVRVTWVDWANNVRYRVLPIQYFTKLLENAGKDSAGVLKGRPGISVAKVVFGIVGIGIAEGFGPIDEYLYAIDMSTLRICEYAPGHASVYGWFQEKVPVPQPNAGITQDDRRALEVEFCPRTILRRVVDTAKELTGTSFLVGIETEFILLSSTSPIKAVNNHGWSISAALPSSESVENKALEEIVDCLLKSGVEVQMYHAESAPGQYEVVTGPLEPLQAMDALVHTRETIFNVAAKYGLRATLAPRVYTDNCGSAAHAHMSVHHPSPFPSKHPLLYAHEASFLAGLLTHLPSIALLLLPTPSSYLRMQDGVWSGGTYVSWGVDHREAPVRLCQSHTPSSRNFELKTMDGTANPYLAMAAILAAGLHGMIDSMELTIKELPNDKGASAAMLSKEEREALGIKERLPLSLEEASERFGRSLFIERVFGSAFREKYRNVNKLLKHHLTFGLMDEEALKLMVESY